ncbi:MAG: DUF3014 domain-containing protein [Gammaproteobacteria bacterium]|jgi:hypothetical protein|nr:DUF3014 domain-containing protein [Gammaproteobacteria bacterium]
MNDNKLIFSLAIGVIFLFGLFILLTGDEQEAVTVIVSNESVQEETQVVSQPAIPNNNEEVFASNIEELIEETVEEIIDETLMPLEEVVVVIEPVIEPEATVPTLPSLNESDSFVFEELINIEGGSSILMHLVSEELVRKFVIMVENISRGEFPEQNLPMLFPEERMSVTDLGSEFYLIDEQSYQRFNGLVLSLTNISTETAVDFYQLMKPLFREAYAELALRDSDFNDVFMLAIDNVVNARTALQPQQLIRPNLNYLYANPEIENYSAVDKLLLRLGPENTESLQRRLEFFKRRLELDASLLN